MGAPEPLDVAAAWTMDRKTLAISVVNPTWESQKLRFKLVGARLDSPQARAWVLSGPDDMAFNDPGKPPAVKFDEKTVSGVADTLEVAPVSATIFQIRMKGGL